MPRHSQTSGSVKSRSVPRGDGPTAGAYCVFVIPLKATGCQAVRTRGPRNRVDVEQATSTRSLTDGAVFPSAFSTVLQSSSSSKPPARSPMLRVGSSSIARRSTTSSSVRTPLGPTGAPFGLHLRGHGRAAGPRKPLDRPTRGARLGSTQRQAVALNQIAAGAPTWMPSEAFGSPRKPLSRPD